MFVFSEESHFYIPHFFYSYNSTFIKKELCVIKNDKDQEFFSGLSEKNTDGYRKDKHLYPHK